jgi:CBS domain-containing protein
MVTAGQLLASKGQGAWSVEPETSVYDAVRMMTDRGVGSLLVLKNGKLVGIFSERDFARRMIQTDRSPKTIPVREFMTERVVYVTVDQSSEECMALMTDKRVRHLPVFDGDKLVGVLSIGDLVKSVIEHQKFMIQQLEHYISGSR